MSSQGLETNGTQFPAKQAGHAKIVGCTYSTALAPPSPTDDRKKIVDNKAAGIAAIDAARSINLNVLFAGTTTDDQTFNYSAYGWLGVDNAPNGGQTLIPVEIAKGVVTLGSLALGAAGVGIDVAGALLADTITETSGSKFVSVYSPADNTPAVLRLDCSQYRFVTVQVSNSGGNAVTMDVILVPGDQWMARS